VEFATTSLRLIKLTPQNCQKLVVDGYDEYLAYSGQRLINPITDCEVLNTGDSSAEDALQQVATFLGLAARVPDYELYTFTDSKRTNFFYKRPGSNVVELRYKKYYKADNINTLAEYRNQLNSLFGQVAYLLLPVLAFLAY
jgi:hypothetical protein